MPMFQITIKECRTRIYVVESESKTDAEHYARIAADNNEPADEDSYSSYEVIAEEI